VYLSRLAFQFHMDQTDRWYHRITAGNQRTDGVVEGTSQVYPGVPAQGAPLRNIQARTPTSHTGETRTERSYIEVRDVLRFDFGVPVQ